MLGNYTQEAKQRCLNLVNNDITEIWTALERMPDTSDTQAWKNLMNRFAADYTLTSRFALMRIFAGRASSSQLISPDNPSDGFKVTLSDGTECVIRDISIEHAKNLTEKEFDNFFKLLSQQAAAQSDADPETDNTLILKALHAGEANAPLLTREEGLKLGHILQFSLNEAEEFLLRVFDTDDGFHYNSSSDLTDAYGFLTNSSWKTVAHIKEAYAALYGKQPKNMSEEKQDGWTKDAESSLPDRVHTWTVYNKDKQDELFLDWLGERAEYLDLPSKTALRIYRNLAVYAYRWVAYDEQFANCDIDRTAEDGSRQADFVRGILEITTEPEYFTQTKEELFYNDEISVKKCKVVADKLLFENLNLSMSDQTDKTKPWHVAQVTTKGKITVNGGINTSRTRVCDILAGRVKNIEKSDMLYLLWFISNLCWTGGKKPNVSNRVCDFIDVCTACLNAAGLPPFYPPHLIEQSMMLSIIYAYNDPVQSDPAEVYEYICSSLITTRGGHAS